ncbi:MAG: ankra2 [Cyanobacteria bacterium RYN_339]|nr:ankra2 [Cyanobacteria bacterium RYN_339]
MRAAFLALALLLGAGAPAFASLEADIASAAGAGDFSMVKYLAESGANLNVRDEEGYTPLTWASQHGNTRVADYLIAHGANLNPLDRGGYTPLMWACQEGHFSTVALLLEKGANPWVRNWRGQTAIDLAAMYGRDDRIREVLMKYAQPRTSQPAMGQAFNAPNMAGLRGTLRPDAPAVNALAGNTPTAGRSLAEPNMMVKVVALKKLADTGIKAGQTAEAFVKANSSNPMALLDPDLPLSKDIVTMYADVARDQSLVKARGSLDKIKASWNNRQDSKFTSTIMEADQILKDAGL